MSPRCSDPVPKENVLSVFLEGLLDSTAGVITVVPILLVAHIFGIVFWMGGLLATSMALTRHTQEDSPEVRASLARLERIFLRGLADPGALLTILAGASLIMTNASYYLHAPWLHIKLTFVLLVIGLHGLIAVRTKRFGAGKITLQRNEARIMVLATLLLLLSILIATLVGQVALT
jgi:protoporphyrinogen IX oxidase